ncbi:unnamed protein product [Orchesella dallaii]|uniref:Golgi-associated plant pathogenesis-related protein 1 n=1 Tax=Orchesella dallaii TaxID=48710 RepID=A0ABP1R0M5_9HEXA
MKFQNHPNFFVFQFLYIFAVAILSSYGGNAEKITFYDHSNGGGDSIIYTVYGTGCNNLSSEWNNRISSVNTHDNCILAWEHADCTGRSERIAPGTLHNGHLAGFGFNNAISSFQLYPTSRPQATRPSSSSWLSGAQQAAVDEHNKYRRRHGAPDVEYGSLLNFSAEKYAKLLADFDLNHTEYAREGENVGVYWVENQDEAVRRAVRHWYNEESMYDYNKPGYADKTGHFTAVVWKSTTEVWIGVAWNPKRNWWVVAAFYAPTGNVHGQFRNNVLPPG